MNELIRNLVALQSLEFAEIKVENKEAAAAELRAKVPPPILAHYDRLVARGKRGWPLCANKSAPAATCAFPWP